MRRRLGRGALLVATVAAITGNSVAPVYAAPCPSSEPPDLVAQPPKQLAFNRTWTETYLEPTTGGSYLFDFGSPVVYRLEAANPADPISAPWEVSQSPFDPDPPIVLKPQDGLARLTATWTERHLMTSDQCTQSSSAIIDGVKGRRARFKTRIASRGRFFFVDRSCRPFNLAKPGSVKITLTGDGRTRSARLADQCGTRWKPGYINAGTWHLEDNGTYLLFRPLGARLGAGEHQFKYTVRFRGKIILQGGLAVRVSIR